MKAQVKIAVALCVALALQAAVEAAEYFVNKQGNDANNGASRQTAFLTVQKGVDALKPGDMLTIGPGEYSENVKRADLGSADADTIIRADIPGTALLRGDIPCPEFKKVEGFRFVYAVPFDQKPQAVLEHDTLRVVVEKANVTELEFDPGYFHYDAAAKMLYLSRADLLAPDQRLYTVAVNENSGLELNSPRRVVIEGLAVTGFFPGWGITLTAPVSCVIRDCTCFMNVGGIVLQSPGEIGGKDSGSDNLIEGCTCYGNSFAGISRYVAHNDVIQNCYTYKNVRDGEHFGIMHYLTMTAPILIRNNISWGQSFNFSVKPTGDERLENCVGLGFIRNSNGHTFHNLIAGGNEFDRGANAGADNILLIREPEIDQNVEFADPLNLDFRLQPGSRYRGSAPDKSDRGPYQYEANIFYISPAGNDQADGLSSGAPWRTLERAVNGLRAGDTLYLMKGAYAGVDWQNAARGEKPINIRARGREPVIITGRMTMNGGAEVVFERIVFSGAMALEACRNITFRNCAFSGAAEGLRAQAVRGLRITHGIFTGAPLNIRNSSGIFLSGNLYANSGKPAIQLDSDVAILYSDYNSYKDGAACWQVADAVWPMAELQKRHDRYSQSIEPQIAQEEGAPVLKNAIQFEGRGPNGTSLGTYLEYDPYAGGMSIVGPFLHSTSDTTADIEWWSNYPASYTLTWGETPEMSNIVRNVGGPERFNTFSLNELRPGQTYYFAIKSADASNRQTGVSLPVLNPKDARITFTTAPRAAEARVFYVAPDGNDAQTGLSRDQAFRTVSRAADKVGPGDTVMISTGDYNERVRVRAAGVKGRPITFRSAPGEKATFREENLMRAFDVIFKPDIRFDGLYFRGRDFFGDGFIVRDSARIQWTRCLSASISADRSPEVLIRNCVVEGGWMAVELSSCPDSVVENNVCITTILRQLSANATTIARNNIFCECVRNKTHQTLLELNLANVKESNNCFYLRWPEEEKLAINDLPLPVYRARTGSDAFAANPMMPGTPGRYNGWQRSSDKDFDEFFTANPQLILRGIGLQPEAFSDFKLGVAEWPYDRAWAESVTKAMSAAEALVEAGKDAEALAAYVALAATTPMCDRLKSDLLDLASLCAWRLKEYDQAMTLAKEIPVKLLSARRQMAYFIEQKKYAELLAAFSDKAMGDTIFQEWIVPEQEDVMGDLYYYRSIAYRETGDMAAAETDLKFMNDKRTQWEYRSGEAIHDLAWLRLGDFYRQYLKDDNKALEAYLNVCNRTTWAPWGTPKKPVSTGGSETLVAATKAACEILTKQEKPEEVKKLQDVLQKAQADAAEAFRIEP